jgi:flavin reductase (DIM6/NTAB) family NADH-FMN oxidoreductase RutF
MKVQLGARDILFPIPVALIVSGTFAHPNIITIAWIGMMSCTPPVVAIAVRESRHSLELIREFKDFSINIPSTTHVAAVDYCGMVSGRERDKFADTGFTPLASTIIQAPLIEECPFNLECVVVKEVPISEHIAIFGEIVESHIDTDKVTGTTAADIDMRKVNPLVYCASVDEYWSLGTRVGKSFSAGTVIKNKLSNQEKRKSSR